MIIWHYTHILLIVATGQLIVIKHSATGQLYCPESGAYGQLIKSTLGNPVEPVSSIDGTNRQVWGRPARTPRTCV